ncbi:MAG: hypothetical protein IK073_06855 [Paludibacteraceae bacterium]|nr:hypothetical protein [Paludibacteraceae bacterium]
MRKIYSLVLMATMLLMGANAWADDKSVGTPADLVSAFTNIPSTRTITLTNDVELLAEHTANPLIIEDGQEVTLNLNGYNLKGYTDPVFRVWHGKLIITGTGTFTSRVDAVVIKGSTDPAAENYSVLEVGENVNIVGTNSDYILFVTANGHSAYGAKMIVNGHVTSAKTGLYINGNVNETTGNVPEIYVNGTVVAGSGYAGIYAAGYGKWFIKGNVSGTTGIYAKAGIIEVSDNAHILATATTYVEPDANGNGYTGGDGCAIIQDSKNGYAGGMVLHVTDNATIESQTTDGTGYAINEVKTDASQSKTENIIIESGTITGNIDMTGEVQEQVVLNGTITGGTFSTDISEYLDPTKGALEQTANGYEVVEGCVAMLNSYGLATFSSPNYNVVLPEGVTAWIATGGMTNDALNLTKVAEAGGILPKEAGLILYSETEASVNLNLYKSIADAVNVMGNLLKPAKAWETESFTEAYILHGNELWIYNGTTFKAGKAFLPMTAISTTSAPQRIRMVFNQEQNATAVENVEAESVKAVKFMGEDGQLYIRRGDVVYTVQGQVVK